MLVALPWVARADAFDDELLAIQTRWAEIQYQTADDQKADAFEALRDRSQRFAAAHPERPEAKIWDGIVLSTWAGAKGGLGALSLVKKARQDFEQALAQDERSLDGSALTSLGSLYYQVPGWPIGFGDDDKARELLTRALEINPNGIDSNYFYADFLLDQGDQDGARRYFTKALQAPPRPQRPLADQGRRQDIQSKLKGMNS
ncbi:tetratricopeptide repeat protein [Alloalcanivorax gelatiniphagus]|uniref:Tetratricopeptide repeat protein n=2 Tax=Alloalcanivorax gelatiniphagus TaxID=1194167 RepID=A0ABY2XJY6_9GAMM|nr:tetratricopeptide repeat protein [Alloalcanivorax gelatiniphagus]